MNNKRRIIIIAISILLLTTSICLLTASVKSNRSKAANNDSNINDNFTVANDSNTDSDNEPAPSVLFLPNDKKKNMLLDEPLDNFALSAKEKEQYRNTDIVDVSHSKYSYDDMTRDLQILYSLYSDKMSVTSRGRTSTGRKLYEVIIGNKDAKNHILIHGSIHGREYITAQLLMRQLEFYLKMYTNFSYKDQTIEELFSNVAFHIVPMINPDGVSISQYGLSAVANAKHSKFLNTCYNNDLNAGLIDNLDLDSYLKIWKANVNGVDINKNFDENWSQYTKGRDTPGRLNYKGSKAESEIETKVLVNIVNNNNIVVGIAYHSSGNVIYWDFKQTGKLRSRCKELVDTINDVCGYKVVYSSEEELSCAGFSDWMVLCKDTPAVTIEVGRGIAPISIESFNNIWLSNRDVWSHLAYKYGK